MRDMTEDEKFVFTDKKKRLEKRKEKASPLMEMKKRVANYFGMKWEEVEPDKKEDDG